MEKESTKGKFLQDDGKCVIFLIYTSISYTCRTRGLTTINMLRGKRCWKCFDVKANSDCSKETKEGKALSEALGKIPEQCRDVQAGKFLSEPAKGSVKLRDVK